MIDIRTRTKFLLSASALAPVSAIIFVAEVKLNLRVLEPSHRLVLFNVPYQNLLEILFLGGIFAFFFSLLSLVRDTRTRSRSYG